MTASGPRVDAGPDCANARAVTALEMSTVTSAIFKIFVTFVIFVIFVAFVTYGLDDDAFAASASRFRPKLRALGMA